MEAFNNLFKNLATAGFNQPTDYEILISLVAALGMTLIMWGSYRLSNTRDSYQPKFATTLVALTLVSTILMDLIRSNLALSLGMLGSMSIIRFRTNIQDPRDIGFIFWSVSLGLAAATECYLIGIAGSLLLGIFMIMTAPKNQKEKTLLLVVRGSSTDLDGLQEIVDNYCALTSLKAKNILVDSYELVYQVNINLAQSNQMIKEIFTLGGVDSVNLLAEQKTL